MRALSALLVVCFMSLGFAFAADNSYRFQSLEGGWQAMTKQTDPFDDKKRKIVHIQKRDFTFVCGGLNMRVHSNMYFDGFSFDAKIKYIVDKYDVVAKQGKYATHLGASDLITDDRYFFVALSKEEVQIFRDSRRLKVAGEWASGWMTREIDLRGFATSYDAMCE